jgi:lipid A 3-O-deacylase
VKTMQFAVRVIVLCLLAVPCLPCQASGAETESNAISTSEFSGPFTKGSLSAQFVAGALFGPISWIDDHPALNYVQTNLRLGWMATNPKERKYVGKGNLELLFELTNSAVYKGFGNYFRGFSVLGRYNLFLSNPKLVPYFQFGAGVVVTDADKDLSQTAIGQSIEFSLQTSLGLHYFIGRDWSLDTEAMYHHVSNAGLAKRNGGVNAVGGFAGVTYYFDWLQK